VVDGVVHYCVANMPGAVARTATMALTNATLPYVMRLASEKVESLLAADKHFAAGLNVANGMLVHPAVDEALSSHFPQLTPGARFSGQHLSQQTDSQCPEAEVQAKVGQLN
jgi:alanine dehydrogenase